MKNALRIMKKTVSYVVILSFLSNVLLPVASAQQVSSSSANQASSQPSTGNTEALDPNFSAPLSATAPGTQQTLAVPSLQPSTIAGTSAVERGRMAVQKLLKTVFASSENAVIILDNAAGVSLTTKLIDNQGKAVPAVIQQIPHGSQVYLKILHMNQFRPGKYRLEAVNSFGEKTVQDFTWGVLAINTNKAQYLPGETAQLSMAVLDENGEMVCDADLQLTIHTPKNDDNVLSTNDGTIQVNPECHEHAVTDKPDYQASYSVGSVGEYTMTLTAQTKNGSYTISDTFSVQESVPFVVERSAPTRIYPPLYYPVSLNITANQDFTGDIEDIVPASFDVIASGSGTISSSPVGKEVLADASVRLTMPFVGTHKETQGFGDNLSDPTEKKLYSQYGLLGHDGLDFDMPVGTPVLAADDGEVVLAGDGAYGQTVVLQHPWGKSYYGHLSSISAKIGEKVRAGEQIALSGNTGLSTGAHLHFGIKPLEADMTNGYFGKIDPTAYLMSTDEGILGAKTSSLNAEEKVVKWHVNLKKGDQVTVGYKFKAPLASPEFYTLGPASFIEDGKGTIFTEARQWQIASDATQTFYMTTTNGASPYPTTSDQYATSANASSDVTSFAENKKSAGVYQFQPGVTNTTALGTTASSLPTTPTNSGWIYTGTVLDGNQTASGTWTINYKYSVVYSSAPTTKNLWYRVLKVTCSGGSCSTGTVVSPTDATAPASSGWSKVALSTLPASGVLSAAQSLTFSASTVTWNSGDKLYTEFAIETSSTGSNSGGWKIETNTASDSIVTTNVAPPPPALTQIHYRFRNDDGSETTATWRRAEDTVANRSQNLTIRLRMEVSNKGGSSASGTTYTLEYGTKASTCGAIATWTAVPATTGSAFIMSSSSFVSDSTATTNVAGGLTDDNTNFVAGQVKTTGNTTAGITLATTDFTEIEYSIQATSTSVVGTTYCFRVTNAGSTTNFSYTAYPELTVGQPTIDQKHYRFRNDDGTETSTTGNVLYYNPVGSGFGTAFTIAAGCSANWDCVNDASSNAATSTSAPTNDGATSALTSANGKDYYTLAQNAIPSGSTVTQLDVFAYALDNGNPNTNITLGYCTTCGSSDVMGTAQAVNVASYTQYTQSFTGLSLTTANLNNLQLVVQADGAKANVSTVYVKVTYSTTGATWKAAEDTGISGMTTSQTFRLRIEPANTGGISGTRNFKLQYAVKNGTCAASTFSDVPITATTEPFEMQTSSYFTNGDSTSAQLTATGSFQAGTMIQDPSNTTGSFTANASSYTEDEYMLLVTSNAASGTTYCFQLVDTSLGALDTYSVYPELTMVTTGPTLDQLMRHGKWFSSGGEQPFTF